MSNVDINGRFERISNALAAVLAFRCDLPAPQDIAINRANRATDLPDVALHMTRLEDLALWAKAWDVPMRITEADMYVAVTATQTINETIKFRVWGHMPHGAAWRLVSAHGKALTRQGVDLDPDEVLADLTQLRGTG